MKRDIDKPLGMHGPAPGRPGLGIGKAVVPGLVLAAIVGTGLFFSIGQENWRTPVTEIAAKPEAPAAPVAPAPVEEAVKTTDPAKADGPSIIRVNPEPKPSNSVLVIRDPSALGQNLRIAHLPDRALIEQTESGPLPVRSADGRRPVDVYARPWSGARGARIAIVIGGLGLSQTGTQAAIAKLPGEVTLAFAPQGNSLGRWMQTARQDGHEILMQLPLEPFDYPRVNPGRNTLTVDAAEGDNIAHLRWALSRTTNYTGVMNYMGARFTAENAAFQPVMDELGKRGLLYLDDGSSARSIAPELALKNRVPFAGADQTIDASHERGDILKKLDELERTARAKGTALGVGSGFDATIAAVAEWIGEARKRGIEFVPVSALAFDPEKRN